LTSIETGKKTSAHGGAYERFPSAPSDYQTAASAVSVKRLFEAAVGHAQDRLDWYDNKANQIAPSARRLRRWSIICFAIGTAMPIVMAMLIKLPDSLLAHLGLTAAQLREMPFTEIGYVLLAVAGTFVVFDQFFDQSGSWMRYRQAQARLEVQIADLRYSWASLLAESGGVIADGKAAARFVDLLRDFVVRIELTAEIETKEWATQFKARIEAFDRNPNLKVRLPGEAAAEDTAGAADKKADGAAPVPGSEAGAPGTVQGSATIKVRLAVADADLIQALKMSVDDVDLPIAADGHMEVPLEVGRAHTIAASGMRDGKQVRGELTLTPSLDDEGKPLLLELK
jgi:hypothetical protein